MSTRSGIGIYNPNTKTITGIYCHYDGYWEGVGAQLVQHYTTREKVQELIALGDISSLRERVAPEPGEQHSFDNRAKGVTVAYGRDRGETGIEPCEYDSFDEMLDGIDGEFFYVFLEGKWVGYCVHDKVVRVAGPNLETEWVPAAGLPVRALLLPSL